MAAPVVAQSSLPSPDDSRASAAVVRSVRVVPDPDGPAVEIVTTRPLNPNITLLENPERLVIDLTQAILPAAKVISFRNEEVTGVRVNQFQNAPPITRVVVDLRKPIGYSWDAAGNRLMIRLRSAQTPVGLPATQGGTTLVPSSATSAVVSSPGSTGGSSGQRRSGYDRFKANSRRRSARVPRHHGFGHLLAERARPDARHEYGRPGNRLQVGNSC